MFAPCKVNDNLPDILLKCDKIKWVISTKHLGLIIDNKLKFDLHVSKLTKKVERIGRAINSLSRMVPRGVLINL